MAQIKKITEEKLKEISGSEQFNLKMITKDYYLTVILYLLNEVEGIYFKGGTALQKIFLGYSRLSEDADYTCTRKISEVREDIKSKIAESGLFKKITKNKDVDDFLRLVVHYEGYAGDEGEVFIDLNKRAKLITNAESHEIKHFYGGDIPEFSVTTLSRDEMVAEKMAATISRNKPRDHFDMYKIIGEKIPINLDLVGVKCKRSGCDPDITRMFNRAKKLKGRWDQDLVPLLREEVSFQEVMQTLAKHFDLKVEKEKKLNKK